MFARSRMLTANRGGRPSRRSPGRKQKKERSDFFSFSSWQFFCKYCLSISIWSLFFCGLLAPHSSGLACFQFEKKREKERKCSLQKHKCGLVDLCSSSCTVRTLCSKSGEKKSETISRHSEMFSSLSAVATAATTVSRSGERRGKIFAEFAFSPLLLLPPPL